MRQVSTIAMALVTIGCSSWVGRNDQPAFSIDPTQPFRLEFGRGSGRDGLETVRVNPDGRVVLYRLKQGQQEYAWETSTLQLSPETLTKVLQAVEANGLTQLQPTYQNPKIADGTQWVLWIKQGEREKAVYFNNSFPPQITHFAKQLDSMLLAAGLDKATWQLVPANEPRRHDHELWESIKRKS
jgi:hypothetical protein